mmetsp:Transcript_127545/g.366927  ORF Transcript_127545/g.366927 Transcript_127545/m.366927 type:complete len:213 (-) Transcript_127545:337-975(-)
MVAPCVADDGAGDVVVLVPPLANVVPQQFKLQSQGCCRRDQLGDGRPDVHCVGLHLRGQVSGKAQLHQGGQHVTCGLAQPAPQSFLRRGTRGSFCGVNRDGLGHSVFHAQDARFTQAVDHVLCLTPFRRKGADDTDAAEMLGFGVEQPRDAVCYEQGVRAAIVATLHTRPVRRIRRFRLCHAELAEELAIGSIRCCIIFQRIYNIRNHSEGH